MALTKVLLMNFAQPMHGAQNIDQHWMMNARDYALQHLFPQTHWKLVDELAASFGGELFYCE